MNSPLCAAFAATFLGAAASLHAQPAVPVIAGSDLAVCNKGAVPAEVAGATKGADILRGFGKYYWKIEAVTVVPQHCTVFDNREGDPSYVGFGFADARGAWGSGVIGQVPDFGSIRRSLLSGDERVMAGATKVMCARSGTTYAIDDDFSIDCTTVKLTGRGSDAVQGPFLPVMSALYFHPNSYVCGTPYAGGPYVCETTHYYLNVSPVATERELHAARGTKSGADAAPKDGVSESGDTRVLRAIAKAFADEREREAKAHADSVAAQEQHLRDQAAARIERDKRILAADSAGNRNVTVEAQMIRRDAETNKQRWAGTRQSPAAWDPQWMGQGLVVTGTVSRVDVDTKGYPKWVTIYFKESPDAAFVVCSPYPDLFQERVGLNLAAMVGKTLEVAGSVESPMCGGKAAKGSIRAVESKQWQIR